MPFRDRRQAGEVLAAELDRRGIHGLEVVVLGLPRGGVVVAYEVARTLKAPLDVIVVRKLGVPFQPELAMGAIGEGGVRVLDFEVLQAAHVGEEQLAAVEANERRHLEERARSIRSVRPREPLVGRTAVIVDDGVATGASARAATQVARALGAQRVVLAVPVAPPPSLAELAGLADEVVCLESPVPFIAVGQWYRDFSHTSDEQVLSLLRRSRYELAGLPSGAAPTTVDVEVDASGARLAGILTLPDELGGVVVFAHGSGSSRLSPRNRQVAESLNSIGLGTLLFDLLTAEEETDRSRVFDVELLACRLRAAVEWVGSRPDTAGIKLGCFGASTGAAAALFEAARPTSALEAVVLRGGRPDLASEVLGQVRAPTLLIVGALDPVVLALNREAQQHLRCVNELRVIPGATHLFEEPGAMDEVAQLARSWFSRYLASG